MTLGRWRALVVLAVAFSACVGVYELLAPRIDFADGAVQPVGAWFSIPGRPTATYLVLSEASGSNLAAPVSLRAIASYRMTRSWRAGCGIPASASR